jgi:hypothetical protein
MFYWSGVSYIYRSDIMKNRSKDWRRVRGVAEGEIYRGGNLHIEIIAISHLVHSLRYRRLLVCCDAFRF